MVKVSLSETARLALFFASPRFFYVLKCKAKIPCKNARLLDADMRAKIETARPEKFRTNFARPVFLKGPFTTPPIRLGDFIT